MSSSPILIQGLCKRTGTNYLCQLIRRHPETGEARPIWEHFLLNEAEALVRYAERTRRHWAPKWGDLQEFEADLLRHVGDGALRFLEDRAGGSRLVAKSPSVRNIGLVPRLLTDVHIIVLVRDGRSTAASLARGFDWSLERSMRTWAEGAAEAKSFLESVGLPSTNPRAPVRVAPSRDGLHVCLARYEDFVDPSPQTMRTLMTFCELDPDSFDSEAAADIKVYASSFDKGDEELHWKGEARSAEFDPTSRFGDWSDAEHDRFDSIGGELNEWFGYERSGAGGGAAHLLADALWPARKQAIRVTSRLEALRGR